MSGIRCHHRPNAISMGARLGCPVPTLPRARPASTLTLLLPAAARSC